MHLLVQGIKFYDPEVVGSSPESVEFRGIQNLLAAVKQSRSLGDAIVIFHADGEVILEETLLLASSSKPLSEIHELG